MAYYQFDCTFVNLAALPTGASGISVYMIFSVPEGASGYGAIPVSGDLTISIDTSAPEFGDAFELAATDQVWLEVTVPGEPVAPDPPNNLAAYMLGPYLVGDIGTEVPAP